MKRTYPFPLSFPASVSFSGISQCSRHRRVEKASLACRVDMLRRQRGGRLREPEPRLTFSFFFSPSGFSLHCRLALGNACLWALVRALRMDVPRVDSLVRAMDLMRASGTSMV